ESDAAGCPGRDRTRDRHGFADGAGRGRLPCDVGREDLRQPATEPVRMIEPPSLSSGRAFCTVNNVPFTLMLNSLSKCSSVILPRGANSATPALAKSTSIRPFALTA